jgi:hypothetical protein
MIAEAVARIQAIEQQLTEKTPLQLRARLAIRACLTELRDIRRPVNPKNRVVGEEPTINSPGRVAS